MKKKNDVITNYYKQNAALLQTMKPMVSYNEMINNLEMAIPESMILNGGSEGVKIIERYKNEEVRVTQLVFDMHGFVPKHMHPHWCGIKVLSGVIVDTVNDIVVSSGEVLFYKPGKEHNAIATQVSEVIVFNTTMGAVAKEIERRGDYFYKGKKVNYQLIPLESFGLVAYK